MQNQNTHRSTNLEVQLNELSKRWNWSYLKANGWKPKMWLPVTYTHRDGYLVEFPWSTKENPHTWVEHEDIAATRTIPTFPKFQIGDLPKTLTWIE
jgi:hypothetical protein